MGPVIQLLPPLKVNPANLQRVGAITDFENDAAALTKLF